jgi:hypothetical protein
MWWKLQIINFVIIQLSLPLLPPLSKETLSPICISKWLSICGSVPLYVINWIILRIYVPLVFVYSGYCSSPYVESSEIKYLKMLKESWQVFSQTVRSVVCMLITSRNEKQCLSQYMKTLRIMSIILSDKVIVMRFTSESHKNAMDYKLG